MTSRWEVERAVLASELPAPARLIMLVLATHTSRGGTEVAGQYTPSLSQLATETGASEATIKRMLIVLETAGWVTRHKPSAAAARTRKVRTRYTLTIPAGLCVSPAEPEQGPHRAQPWAHGEPWLGSHSASAGPTVSHRSEESKDTKAHQPRATPTARLAAVASATEEEIELLINTISAERPDIRSPLAYLKACHDNGDLADQLAGLRAKHQKAAISEELAQARTGLECAHGIAGGQHRRSDTGRLLCPQCQLAAPKEAS